MSRSPLAYLVPTEHRRVNEFIGLLLATVAILVGLSLISFNPADPSFNISRSPQFDAKPVNFIGVVGSYLADGFFQTLGYAPESLAVVNISKGENRAKNAQLKTRNLFSVEVVT